MAVEVAVGAANAAAMTEVAAVEAPRDAQVTGCARLATITTFLTARNVIDAKHRSLNPQVEAKAAAVAAVDLIIMETDTRAIGAATALEAGADPITATVITTEIVAAVRATLETTGITTEIGTEIVAMAEAVAAVVAVVVVAALRGVT